MEDFQIDLNFHKNFPKNFPLAKPPPRAFEDFKWKVNFNDRHFSLSSILIAKVPATVDFLNFSSADASLPRGPMKINEENNWIELIKFAGYGPGRHQLTIIRDSCDYDINWSN